MNCPRCDHLLEPDAARCPRCGLRQAMLEVLLREWFLALSPAWHASVRVIADDKICDPQCVSDLENVLAEFESHFPDLTWRLIIAEMPAQVNPLEVGMWLLNQPQAIQQRQASFGLAWVIDPVARQHGLALGYQLEAYFPPTQLQLILKMLRSTMADGQFLQAGRILAHEITATLRMRHLAQLRSR